MDFKLMRFLGDNFDEASVTPFGFIVIYSLYGFFSP